MKQLKLIIIIFLITSMALGDKLYLKNGWVIEGKYEGIVGGHPIFISADTNTPVDFNPEDFLKITNDYFDTIVWAKQYPDGEIYFRELKRQPINVGEVGIKDGPPQAWPYACLFLVAVVVVVIVLVFAQDVLLEIFFH